MLSVMLVCQQCFILEDGKLKNYSRQTIGQNGEGLKPLSDFNSSIHLQNVMTAGLPNVYFYAFILESTGSCICPMTFIGGPFVKVTRGKRIVVLQFLILYLGFKGQVFVSPLGRCHLIPGLVSPFLLVCYAYIFFFSGWYHSHLLKIFSACNCKLFAESDAYVHLSCPHITNRDE